jgi:hypothetical protein
MKCRVITPQLGPSAREAIFATALLVALAVISPTTEADPLNGVLTQHNNNQRTGANLSSKVIDPDDRRFAWIF